MGQVPKAGATATRWAQVNLLALDTSTLHAAIALRRSDSRVFEARPDPTTRHGRALIPAIRDLLAAAGLGVHDLDAIAVGLGPGSYTGLRIGVMAAKTLAFAAGKALVGLDSLAVLARNAPDDACDIRVVIDAQRGEIGVADFRREAPGGHLVSTGPPDIQPIATWAADLPPGAFVLGPAFDRVKDALPTTVLRAEGDARNQPDPARLIAFAIERFEAGDRADLMFLEPHYLRRSAAEDQWTKLGK